LYETISLFAKEKGYPEKSELIRQILETYFMNIMLGFHDGDFDKLNEKFLEKFIKNKSNNIKELEAVTVGR
jgi:hypothetical protein